MIDKKEEVYKKGYIDGGLATKSVSGEVEKIFSRLAEGYVIWKYEGVVRGGRAKYMSNIYVDDYPTNIKEGEELRQYIQPTKDSREVEE